MSFRKSAFYSACFFLAVALSSSAARAQSNCTASQAAAIQCFVSNAVSTDITKPRHGMTLTQFEAYGVSVNSIIQSNHTYLILVGLSSAIADAMPPTNADGSANLSAQDSAIGAIVAAAVNDHLANLSTGVTVQDLQYFSIDVTNAMNDNNSYLALLTPGVALRIIDSYVVSATSNGSVNWTDANNGVSSAIQNMVASKMIKIPPGVSEADLKAFAETIGKAIYTYKVATKRSTL
jgi:hypothetical protein